MNLLFVMCYTIKAFLTSENLVKAYTYNSKTKVVQLIARV